jgi:hypothetical protein
MNFSKFKMALPLLSLLLAGCRTPYTSFAPFDARLEPSPRGGAVYLVLINRSDKTLHNYTCSVYVWSEHFPGYDRMPKIIGRGVTNGRRVDPGTSIRFRSWGMQMEMPIPVSVSKVEIIGNCEEGAFRQGWENSGSGLIPIAPRGLPSNTQSNAAPRLITAAVPGDPR